MSNQMWMNGKIKTSMHEGGAAGYMPINCMKWKKGIVNIPETMEEWQEGVFCEKLSPFLEYQQTFQVLP